ncbi:hypothetical protein F5Y05DRAFT_414624 [Hypoxylon sp. FL0543]|nr:hypothetical protein F5Y05DRAFT_414624 [Hypoxylon sp. FL0543]
MPEAARRRRGAEYKDTFARPPPAAVAYDVSVRDEATISVPPGSTWTSGPHWHEAHTEFLRVLAGRARIVLSGRSFVVGAGDGVVLVPRGAVHEWGRADGGLGLRVSGDSTEDGEREGEREGDGEGDGDGDGDKEVLVVREWTQPRDGAKEVFFRNLNGLILDAAEGGRRGVWLELELWNLFWRADNYPVVLGSGWVGGVATKVVMGVAVALGWVVGCQGVYEEYSAR